MADCSAIRGLSLTHKAFEIPRVAFNILKKDLSLNLYFNYVVRRDPFELRLVGYEGIPSDVAAEIERLDMGAAVCGRVAATGEAQLIFDVQYSMDPGLSIVRSFGARVYCCIPVKVSGQVVATLSFGSLERDSYSAAELDSLFAIADEFAKAYQKLVPVRLDEGPKGEQAHG